LGEVIASLAQQAAKSGRICAQPVINPQSTSPAGAGVVGYDEAMRFGVSTFITDEGIRPDVLGRALEERGFSSLFIAEHSHIPVSRESPYPGGGELPRKYARTLDPFVALTAAAAVTSRLTLGTGIVLLPQRDVIHTAKQVASLDLVSDGRVAFGVGVGWNREEMRNHGTDPAIRGALVDEQLAALKQIWTAEQAEFHGKYVDFDPIYLWPKPVQKPHPPIYLGGESGPALRRLATYGDAWLPRSHTPPQEIRRVREWLVEQGREGVPFTVFGSGTDEGRLAGFAEAGVDEVTLSLETLPEADTLRSLDALAAVAARSR
jgi:probable F420-dependent oxidoreductase